MSHDMGKGKDSLPSYYFSVVFAARTFGVGNQRGNRRMIPILFPAGEAMINGAPDAPGNVLHPGRLTWNLKMMVWKMIFLFNWVIFRFHVNLPGCTRNPKAKQFF